jgi:hypothetical protein
MYFGVPAFPSNAVVMPPNTSTTTVQYPPGVGPGGYTGSTTTVTQTGPSVLPMRGPVLMPQQMMSAPLYGGYGQMAMSQQQQSFAYAGVGGGYPVQQSSYTTSYDPTPWNGTYDPTVQTVTNRTSYVPVDVTPWDGVYNPILMRQDTRTVTTMQDVTPWDGVYNPVVTTQQQTTLRPV